MPAKTPRPLWRCPKCGKYYVTRNILHACARHTVAGHFEGKNPAVRFLFDGLLGILKRCGPVRVVPGKTSIVFQVRMRFAGATVRRNSLEVTFVLPRRLDHPRVKKCLVYSRRSYYHYIDISTPADLDEELMQWLREAYRVGQQADVLAGRKPPRLQTGDFSWSEPYGAASTRARSPENFAFSAPAAKAPPLKPNRWTCPKCGRHFPVLDQKHVCANKTLDEALKGKDPRGVALLRKFEALAQRCGPVKMYPQKTRFALQITKTFVGVRLLRAAIDCEILLPRRIEDKRFRQILSASPRSHYHFLRISSAGELDRAVLGWLREAAQHAR
jgi:hypothetical protein